MNLGDTVHVHPCEDQGLPICVFATIRALDYSGPFGQRIDRAETRAIYWNDKLIYISS